MQLVCLSQHVQKAVIEIFSLSQQNIEQFFSSPCRPVTAQSLNLLKLFGVQRRAFLVQAIGRFTGIQLLRKFFINVPNAPFVAYTVYLHVLCSTF